MSDWVENSDEETQIKVFKEAAQIIADIMSKVKSIKLSICKWYL